MDQCTKDAAQTATGHGRSRSTLSLGGLVEVDDAFIGGKCSGRRGRGAAGKTPILAAVERRVDGAGFLAVEVVERVDHQHVQQFTQCLQPTAEVRSDAFAALNIVSEHCQQEARVTPPKLAGQWLPMIHIVIGNLKVSCWEPSMGSAVHTYTSTFTNLCIASIVAYGKSNCHNGCYMRPPITIQFPYESG